MYDFIIIGQGLRAVLAAAQLAERGSEGTALVENAGCPDINLLRRPDKKIHGFGKALFWRKPSAYHVHTHR